MGAERWWHLSHALQDDVGLCVGDLLQKGGVIVFETILFGGEQRRGEVTHLLLVDFQNLIFGISDGLLIGGSRFVTKNEVRNGLGPRWWSIGRFCFGELTFDTVVVLSGNIHTHGGFDDFWRSLDSHVGILDLVVILVGHFSQIRIDVVETLLIFFEDQVVVVLVHLRDLSLLFQQIELLDLFWCLASLVDGLLFHEAEVDCWSLGWTGILGFGFEWLGVEVEKALVDIANIFFSCLIQINFQS